MAKKYIDAEKLKAEIDKLIDDAPSYDDSKAYLFKVCSIIDSLPQEQPTGEEYTIEVGKHTHTLRVGSQSDIDNLIRQEKQEQMDRVLGRTALEKAAINCKEQIARENPGGSWDCTDVQNAFKAGAEWQKKQDELTWEDIKRIIQIADSMLTGTAWDAVDYPDEQKYYEEVLKRYKEEKK